MTDPVNHGFFNPRFLVGEEVPVPRTLPGVSSFGTKKHSPKPLVLSFALHTPSPRKRACRRLELEATEEGMGSSGSNGEERTTSPIFPQRPPTPLFACCPKDAAGPLAPAQDGEKALMQTARRVQQHTLPRPDFSILDEVFSFSSSEEAEMPHRQSLPTAPKSPPPAPKKKSRVSSRRKEENATYIAGRKKIIQQLEAASSPTNPQIQPLPSDGRFKEVFRQSGHIIKVYKLEHVMDEKPLAEWTVNAMEQRQWCQERGIPCAQLYNIPKADGYFDEEFIPYSVQDKWPQISSGPALRNSYLETIAGIFILAIEGEISLDPQPNNFRIRENGEICLIDFREEKPPKDEAYMNLRGALVKPSMIDRTTWAYQFPDFAAELIQRLKEKLGPQHPFFNGLED